MVDSTKGAGGGRPRQRHALIVDDSRTVRRILRETLEELGYTVGEAEDGRDGLAQLALLAQRSGAELVLVDWEMPEMDGITFVRSVRGDPAYRDVRLVMVTKETGLHSVTEALASGADEYIMKPFTKEVVRKKLEILGESRGE